MPEYYKRKAPRRKYDMERSMKYAKNNLDKFIYNCQQANEWHRVFYGYYDKEFEILALEAVKLKMVIDIRLAKVRGRD